MKKAMTRVLLCSVAWGGLIIGQPIVEARADTLSNCQTINGFWFTKGTKRTICDGVRRPDGSWLRVREFWTPAYWKPLRTSCYGYSYISCTTTGGYHVEQSSSGVESYVVFDHNVLPDEPGHLQ